MGRRVALSSRALVDGEREREMKERRKKERKGRLG